jgi:hypothetical protein
MEAKGETRRVEGGEKQQRDGCGQIEGDASKEYTVDAVNTRTLSLQAAYSKPVRGEMANTPTDEVVMGQTLSGATRVATPAVVTAMILPG